VGVGELLAFDDELLLLALHEADIIQGTDAGEHISQPTVPVSSDNPVTTENASIAVMAAEITAGADSNGSVNNAVAIFDFDGSQSVRTSTVVDTDRGQLVDGKGVSLADSDSGTGADAQAAAAILGADTFTGADGK